MTKLYEQSNTITLGVIFLSVVVFFNTSISYGFERKTAVVKAVEEVSPAVVNISSEYEVRGRSNPFSGFGMDPFFDSFFRDFFDHGYEQRYKRSSLGSGVIIDGHRGFILTNAHVIMGTDNITVVLKDEREFEAKIIGVDPDSDLAVLKIVSDKTLPAIEMGNSDTIMIGETGIAIGNPFGFSNTVTTGVISALNRSINTEARVYHDFIQTDASINPGNSGGPLLNINGELIGINTAIYAKAQGIGFAIPINKAKRIVSDLILHGEVVHVWTGIFVQDMDQRLAAYLNVPGKKGVVVSEIENKSPAHENGIKTGDIILSVGAKKIASSQEYLAAIKDYASGDTARITVWREDRKIEFSFTVFTFPPEKAHELAYLRLGIKIKGLNRKNRRKYDIKAESGVVITEIKRDFSLAKTGVKPGDVIRQIGEIAINNKKDFEKAIIKFRHKYSVAILIQRGSRGYYISVKM